mmetsp:Transcript_2881/g.4203  ORF Transcript_2881/g.4203 Transcript_2881/m.4203 type:complete len:421 (+) Transcript_2881:106-1368(+)
MMLVTSSSPLRRLSNGRKSSNLITHCLLSFALSSALVIGVLNSQQAKSLSNVASGVSARTRSYGNVIRMPSPSYFAARSRSESRKPSSSASMYHQTFRAPSSPQFQAKRSLMPVYAEDSMKAGGFNTAGEAPFEIRGFSLGNAVLGVGSLILAASFSTFFKGDASGGSGIGFVYGVPIMLIGFALKYAELEPVPLISDVEANSIFDTKASENLKKMKSDVTRHRYGDEAHMDTALKALGLWVAGKAPPKLLRLKEQVDAGEIIFSMYFDSPGTPIEMWTDPLMKVRIEKFFGPGLTAAIEQIEEEGKERIVVQLRSGEVKEADVKTQVQKVEDGSVISVNLNEKPLGTVISEADTLVKSVSAKAEGLGIKPGMRIQAINGYEVTKLNWLKAYQTFEPPMVIDFWVPEELRDPIAKGTSDD